MMKWFFRLILLVSILSAGTTSSSHIAEVISVEVNSIQGITDIDVLVLVANGVGESYFINKEQLESWGCNTITVNCGLTENVVYCPNQEPRPITTDILISEIEDITDYDCVLIPSGGHWSILSANHEVRELISVAHDEGLIVASICVGLAVVASADIINGTKVAGHPNANAAVNAAGGIIVYSRVVSDDRVVTAGSGGGPGIGASAAPNQEFCLALVKEVLGYSYSVNTEIEKLSGGEETGYSINVKTTDLAEFKNSLNASSSEIYRVNAILYDVSDETNVSFIQNIELKDNDNDSTYNGTFNGLERGKYRVDVEIRDIIGNMEVIRNALTFSAGAAVSGWELPTFIAGTALFSCMSKDRKRRKPS
ncbi:MAG: DJ-1/PfpI family protein [Candidatus Odinarchaeota archaeon]